MKPAERGSLAAAHDHEAWVKSKATPHIRIRQDPSGGPLISSIWGISCVSGAGPGSGITEKNESDPGPAFMDPTL